MYRSCNDSGVAAPGLLIESKSPPSLSTAATSSASSERNTPTVILMNVCGTLGSLSLPAQKKLLLSVCRGQNKDRAIADLEKGLPTQLCAKLSIFRSCALEQPSWRYEYLQNTISFTVMPLFTWKVDALNSKGCGLLWVLSRTRRQFLHRAKIQTVVSIKIEKRSVSGSSLSGMPRQSCH